MTPESIMICIDDSEYSRNEDFYVTRLTFQCQLIHKILGLVSNFYPDSNAGLLSLADPTKVLVPFTTDVIRISMKMRELQPQGMSQFVAGVRLAHRALESRPEKGHVKKIVVFVASPEDTEQEELNQLAEYLRENLVAVIVINFGELDRPKWEAFITAVCGGDRINSYYITIRRHDETRALDPEIVPEEFPELRTLVLMSIQQLRQLRITAAYPLATFMDYFPYPGDQLQGQGLEIPTTPPAASDQMSTDSSSSSISRAAAEVLDQMDEVEKLEFALQLSLQEYTSDSSTSSSGRSISESSTSAACRSISDQAVQEEVDVDAEVSQEVPLDLSLKRGNDDPQSD